jgi:hypothetical protein
METQDIIRMVVEGAFSVVFLWLYIQERKNHKESTERHMADLRQVAGMQPQLPPRTPNSRGFDPQPKTDTGELREYKKTGS